MAVTQNLANPLALLGSYYFARLPLANTFPIGTAAFTVDQGIVYSNGTSWQTSPLNIYPGLAGSQFTSIAAGVVPATGGVDGTHYIGADGNWTVPAGSGGLTAPVLNSQLATMAAGTFKGNNTGIPALPIDMTVVQAKILLAISLSTDVSGVLQAAQMPALTGDVTTPGASYATTIVANAVTNAKAAQVPANTLKGNNTGSIANVSDLTVTQILAMLSLAPLGFFIISPSGETDTTNIQNAINSASTSPSAVVFMTAGSWNMGPVLIQSAGVHIVGSGQDATFINFTPTNNVTTPGSGTVDPGTCFQFCQAGGTAGNILYNCSIENMSIASSDITFTKNGIRSVETSQLIVSRVQITGMYGGNSVGIQTMGHELTHVRDVHIEACIPIRISQSPTAYSSVHYSGDHTRFTNCYLIAGTATNVGTAKYFPTTLPSACVLIDDAVFLSNFGFDGYQAWVGGQYSLYWVQPTTPVSIIYQLYFRNVRTEQGWGSQFNFYIDHTSSPELIRNIIYDNCYLTNTGPGWYLRNMFFNTMLNCQSNQTTVVDAGSLLGMVWVNMWTTSASVNSMGGLRGPFQATYYTGYLLPITGTWVNNGFPIVNQTKSVQTPSTGFTITIANNITALILRPAGTLATGTVTMPATPLDEQEVTISTTQILSALTVSPNSGQSIDAPPTTLAAGAGCKFIYNAGSTTWNRLY